MMIIQVCSNDFDSVIFLDFIKEKFKKIKKSTFLKLSSQIVQDFTKLITGTISINFVWIVGIWWFLAKLQKGELSHLFQNGMQNLKS